MKITGINFELSLNVASFSENTKRVDSREGSDRNNNNVVELNGLDFDINYQIDSIEVDPEEIQSLFNCVTASLKSAFDAKVDEARVEAESKKQQ